jgi:hypothetical protein
MANRRYVPAAMEQQCESESNSTPDVENFSNSALVFTLGSNRLTVGHSGRLQTITTY